LARVSTYLNFPGTTEEAFTFYRSVFGGGFNGPIHRFADIPPQPGQPPMSDADKQMVMHIELPILGGHVLMGTDAPESMGFKCVGGSNTYINLEPDTRAEADRLFAGLSAGGKVEMPMQDMFWGAYFGSFTDRFGINWMVNCAPT
jgi:PhnB protein